MICIYHHLQKTKQGSQIYHHSLLAYNSSRVHWLQHDTFSRFQQPNKPPSIDSQKMVHVQDSQVQTTFRGDGDRTKIKKNAKSCSSSKAPRLLYRKLHDGKHHMVSNNKSYETFKAAHVPVSLSHIDAFDQKKIKMKESKDQKTKTKSLVAGRD